MGGKKRRRTERAQTDRTRERQRSIPGGKIGKREQRPKFAAHREPATGRVHSVAGEEIARLLMKIRDVTRRMARRRDGAKAGPSFVGAEKSARLRDACRMLPARRPAAVVGLWAAIARQQEGGARRSGDFDVA